ncbi:hypothetical protein G7Y89_g14094 [Cudoniella acicularis]|uniref:Alpha/beta hydrolase fold-3 domain-containing protein n=1 Tax=Cudoniella acicularis TaxID=354080 RepID=A0A8H4R5P4_9HELO|nr:hypothetical protein G7Y89_g14094 [Cudoniella acicularis]
MGSEIPQIIYQPIHPSVRPLLDPQYVNFHEKYLQYVPSSESVPWDPACRFEPSPSAAGGSPLVEVGSTRDFDYGGDEKLRIFTPKGDAPSGGWPVLVWMHGGGWTMGGLSSENSFLTRLCSNASCVVVSVNYRHAPENPYPAAINDVVTGFSWIVSPAGKKALHIDVGRVAIGGLSAGGGLAAILSLKAASLKPPVSITFQLLIVPVIDNTASTTSCWESNAHAPWLTPNRMMWYRKMYLPNEKNWTNWDASPNFAPAALLAKSPKTWIAVAELDILCDEGVKFGEQLRAEGVDAEVVVYPGSTHSILILDVVKWPSRPPPTGERTQAPTNMATPDENAVNSSETYIRAAQLKLTRLQQLFGTPSPAEFISIIQNFTTFNDPERRKRIKFQDKLGLFGFYAKKLLPLGRAGSKTYYIHIYAVTADGSLDMKKLLVFRRLIVKQVQTYWVVAMDEEHKLWALRASRIGPDETYDDNDSLNWRESDAISTRNEPSGNADAPSGSSTIITSTSGADLQIYNDTPGTIEMQHLSLDGDHSIEKDIMERATMESADTDSTDMDGHSTNTERDGTKSTESTNHIGDSKRFVTDSAEYRIFHAAVFSKEHSKIENVFNATATQHVFELGPLGLLWQAIDNTEQKFFPKPSDITSWTSMQISNN